MNISKIELKKLISSKGKYILIDVRTKEEVEQGFIQTAQHIPLGDLQSAFDLDEKSFEKKYKFRLDKKIPLIFYCHSGGRSAMATALALRKGYDAKNLTGGFMNWN